GLWTLAWAMGVKRNAPGAPPRICVSVWPTSPGMALTLLTRGAQSETSGTRSLSSSGSMQLASPSPSVSGKPLSTRPSQLSSMPLQAAVVGVAGVQVRGGPVAEGGALRWQGPRPPGGGVAVAGAVAARGGAETVVDRAVAVVVDVVAGLGRGGAWGAGLGDAGDAVVGGALAGADAARGGAEIVVDRAVAVVVDVVAD